MEKNYISSIVIIPVNDAETVAIRDLCIRHLIPFIETKQGWGASWRNVEDEIALAIRDNPDVTFYGVELQGYALADNCVNIDHHVYENEDRYDERSSIEQFCELFNIYFGVDEQLVSLNDTGYIPAMQEYLATINCHRYRKTPAEMIQRVRLMDRSAQGITPEQEEAAEAAIANREEYGHLTVVKMSHSKCATVTDRLFGKYENLLILSEDGEVNFYGDGTVCTSLQEKFGGWSGGQLPKSGFWGGYPDQTEVLDFVKGSLK